MIVLAAEEGRTACPSCPFRDDSGWVRCYGGWKKTHCQMVMHEWNMDCNKYNIRSVQELHIPKDKWQEMLKAGHLRPKKMRKLYKQDHAEIHHVGANGGDPYLAAFDKKNNINNQS